MDIFGYIKLRKRISPDHKRMFEGKQLILWYQGKPIIGTMISGIWYQVDISGDREQLLFQRSVTHVSFLPSPNEKKSP